MVRYYCPTCWGVVDRAAVRCTECGAALHEKDRDIVLRYVDALRNPEPTRAALACEMLAKLGDRRAVPPLVTLIESRPRAYEVLCAAVKALGQFGLPGTASVLIDVLQDLRAAIPARVEALHALVSFWGADCCSRARLGGDERSAFAASLCIGVSNRHCRV